MEYEESPWGRLFSLYGNLCSGEIEVANTHSVTVDLDVMLREIEPHLQAAQALLKKVLIAAEQDQA